MTDTDCGLDGPLSRAARVKLAFIDGSPGAAPADLAETACKKRKNPRARKKEHASFIHKSPVDVVVVVAGAALPVEVRPGVLRGRRSVVRLQAVEVDERFVVSQPRDREE